MFVCCIRYTYMCVCILKHWCDCWRCLRLSGSYHLNWINVELVNWQKDNEGKLKLLSWWPFLATAAEMVVNAITRRSLGKLDVFSIRLHLQSQYGKAVKACECFQQSIHRLNRDAKKKKRKRRTKPISGHLAFSFFVQPNTLHFTMDKSPKQNFKYEHFFLHFSIGRGREREREKGVYRLSHNRKLARCLRLPRIWVACEMRNSLTTESNKVTLFAMRKPENADWFTEFIFFFAHAWALSRHCVRPFTFCLHFDCHR